MKRICHIVNGEHYSGAERVQDLLTAYLPEQGYEVEILCLKPGIFPEKSHTDPKQIHAFHMQGRWDLGAVQAIRRFVLDHDISLIHTHSPRTALIGCMVSARSGIPMVHHLHSPAIRCTENRIRNTVNAVSERLAVLGAKRVIAVSRDLSSYAVHAGIPRSAVVQIPNGVPDPGPLPPRPNPAPPFKIAMVSLFRPRKGLHILVQALSRIAAAGIDIKLYAVGSFEKDGYETKIHRKVRSLNLNSRIEWLGFQDNVDSLLARMDLLVLPSLAGEGLPMVVLEAMAAGTPVVATRSEGIGQAVEDGVTGWLCPPGDPVGLADTITRALLSTNVWQRLRLSGRRRYEDRFSADRMAQNVAAVYDEVLAKP